MGREHLNKHKRIVVKVGTTSLTHPNGRMNLRRMERLCWVLTDLKNRGKEIVLVSSGAIGVGTERLGLSERPRDTVLKQAASAVGQAALIKIYDNFFMTYNQKAAQILLTKDDVEDEIRRTNIHNTFSALLSMDILPIVNENDTVSTEELGIGDNDTLSAHVARLVECDLLIILSDVDGMYESDPRKHTDAKLISEITEITDDLERAAGGTTGSLGTGGMTTKITAAKMAAECGIDTVIACGDEPDIIFDIIDGADVGTLFTAPEKG